jgi:hypothetical protein
MPLIVLGGLIGVPAVAIAQAHLFDATAAEAKARDERSNAVARSFIEAGFKPRATVGPDHTEVWTATRPIAWTLANGPVSAEPPSATDIARISAVLDRELARYPQGFLARANMSRVLVCAHLAEKGLEIPSLPNIDGAWLLDATLSDEFATRITHHELYHFVDLAEDGTLDRDAAWDALNAKGFAYGAGGRSLRASWASQPSLLAPGFVTGYAASAVAEDKAETFSLWMTKPQETIQLAQNDAIVERKLRVLRGRLAEEPRTNHH